MGANNFKIIVDGSKNSEIAIDNVINKINNIINKTVETHEKKKVDSIKKNIVLNYNLFKPEIENIELRSEDPDGELPPLLKKKIDTKVTVKEIDKRNFKINIAAKSPAEALSIISDSVGTGVSPNQAVLDEFGVENENDELGMSKWFFEPTNSIGRFINIVRKIIK